MIARDEADFLAQCLQSVQGLVDEIVVVDTGSTDDTPVVARQAGAVLLRHDWNGDFSAARNKSLEAAKGEWILVLDCDEVLAAQDHDAIRRAMEQSDVDAYRITTRNYTDQVNRAGWTAGDSSTYTEQKHYKGWFPTTKVRLWRHKKNVRFAGAVHELVEPAIMQRGGTLADCMVPVHHYGYSEKERSQDHYVEAGERKVQEQPDDLLARYELAVAYRNAGRLADALQSIEQVVADLGQPAVASQVYLEEEFVLLVQADVLDRMGRLEAALAIYQQVLSQYPASYQAFNNAGNILERQGDMMGALAYYERGVQMAPDNQVLADNSTRLKGILPPPTPTDKRLSVCLIARDEEAVIGRCLQSVQGVADEIVVVDTGSRDRTVEIAQQYGAQIGHFSWCDDFAAARNASLDLATGDWILWLDADDYLLPADQQKLGQLKGADTNQAFNFTLVNEGDDRSSFRQVKMFPNHPQLRFERPVHETVVPAIQRLQMARTTAEVEVRHSGYAVAAVTAKKRDYYLGLMRQWLEQHPEDYDICFRVGHTYYNLRERNVAKQYLKRILDAGQDRVESASVFSRAATFYGRCLLEDGDSTAAIAPLQEALSLKTDDALINLSLGDALLKQGQHGQALEYLQRAMAGDVDPNFPVDVQLTRYSAHFFAAQAYTALGRNGEAVEALRQAQEIMPQRTEAAEALAQLETIAPKHTGLYEAEVAPIVAGAGGEGGRLTLCMIVRDEEERLGNCLESARDLVDEIVVVDTGSTDRTVELAESFGAKMGYFEWCDDWAAARNESLKLATGDWILWLDADDLLPQEYHQQIRALTQQGKGKSYFFALDDKGYENVSCLQMRLFPNLPGVEFEMPVHEQVSPSLARLGLEMVATDIRVVHTGYTTPEVVKAKKDRYLGIMANWLETHPENYIVRSHVALTYHTTGRLDEAIEHYRAIIYDSNCWQDRNYVVYTTALLFLGRTYLKKGDCDQALEFAKKAEEVDPDYILTKLSLAEIYDRIGNELQTIKYAQAVLDGGRQMTFFPIDYREVEYSAQILCATAFEKLGQMTAAEGAYRKAAELPVARASEAMGSLSNMFKAQGQWERSIEALQRARELDPDNIQHLFNMGVLCLEQRQLDEAAQHFEAVLEQESDYAPARLNLGYIAKSKGALDQAEQIYRQVIAANTEEVEARANLGHLYLDQERFADASEVFDQVRERDKALQDINLGLLVALAQQGEWERVVELSEEALALFTEVERQPADLSAPIQAARTLVRLGAALVKRQLIKCAELAFAAAVALDPQFLDARRCLADTLAAAGALWQAVAQYEVILSSAPQDGEAFRKLGDCYKQLGVEDAAQLCYARSRQVAGG